MKMKHAQVKIQQMIFMLLAVTLFFVLVGMFVLVIHFSGLKEAATTLEEENAMFLAAKLANSPEFSCGFAFDATKISCIDTDKVMMLKENIAKYSGFWGVKNIEIRKIYPKTDEVVCSLGNYPDCNVIRIRSEKGGYYLSNFVSLCRKESFEGEVYNKCELGRLMVSYDKK